MKTKQALAVVTTRSNQFVIFKMETKFYVQNFEEWNNHAIPIGGVDSYDSLMSSTIPHAITYIEFN